MGNHSITNYSKPSPAYSSNKIRDSPGFRPSQKYVTSFSTMMGSKGRSLNKIDSTKPNSKVDIIKFKCMEKSKVYSKAFKKQFSQPK